MVSLKLFLVLAVVHVSASFKHQKSNSGNAHRKGHGRFRIIAGRPADISEFPYQASMEHYGQQWCGASILSRRIVITAAHCIQPIKNYHNVPMSIMQIRVGNSVSSSGGQTYGIKEVIAHERYNEDPSVDEHDIALIVLSKPLKFSDKVKPIELTRTEPEDGKMAWVTGFGRQDPMRRMLQAQSRHLMAVEIPIMNRERCIEIHNKYGNIVTDKMICAGNTSGNKDSCKGDSGGPLAVDNKLVGVVAWGIGCGREGIPGVYTNVAEYLPWIEDHMTAAEAEFESETKRDTENLYRYYLNRRHM